MATTPITFIRNWGGQELLVTQERGTFKTTVEPVDLESYEAFVNEMYEQDPATFAARVHELTMRCAEEERSWKNEAQAKLDVVRKELCAKIGEEIREDAVKAAAKDREFGTYFA